MFFACATTHEVASLESSECTGIGSLPASRRLELAVKQLQLWEKRSNGSSRTAVGDAGGIVGSAHARAARAIAETRALQGTCATKDSMNVVHRRCTYVRGHNPLDLSCSCPSAKWCRAHKSHAADVRRGTPGQAGTRTLSRPNHPKVAEQVGNGYKSGRGAHSRFARSCQSGRWGRRRRWLQGSTCRCNARRSRLGLQSTLSLGCSLCETQKPSCSRILITNPCHRGSTGASVIPRPELWGIVRPDQKCYIAFQY